MIGLDLIAILFLSFTLFAVIVIIIMIDKKNAWHLLKKRVKGEIPLERHNASEYSIDDVTIYYHIPQKGRIRQHGIINKSKDTWDIKDENGLPVHEIKQSNLRPLNLKQCMLSGNFKNLEFEEISDDYLLELRTKLDFYKEKHNSSLQEMDHMSKLSATVMTERAREENKIAKTRFQGRRLSQFISKKDYSKTKQENVEPPETEEY